MENLWLMFIVEEPTADTSVNDLYSLALNAEIKHRQYVCVHVKHVCSPVDVHPVQTIMMA